MFPKAIILRTDKKSTLSLSFQLQHNGKKYIPAADNKSAQKRRTSLQPTEFDAAEDKESCI